MRSLVVTIATGLVMAATGLVVGNTIAYESLHEDHGFVKVDPRLP